MLETELINFIMTKIEKKNFLDIKDAIESAYAEADQSAEATMRYTSAAKLKGYMRRYCIDDQLAGLSACSPKSNHTIPTGEQFTTLNFPEVTVGHVESSSKKIPRKSNYQNQLALQNNSIENHNLDLFKEDFETNSINTLYLVIVVIRPNIDAEKQNSPAQILIAVPYTNWNDYHLTIPLNDLILKYNNSSINNSYDDMAWPKLKTQMTDLEIKNA